MMHYSIEPRDESADKSTKISKISRQNSSETVKSETEYIGSDREISKERYISPE